MRSFVNATLKEALSIIIIIIGTSVLYVVTPAGEYLQTLYDKYSLYFDYYLKVDFMYDPQLSHFDSVLSENDNCGFEFHFRMQIANISKKKVTIDYINFFIPFEKPIQGANGFYIVPDRFLTTEAQEDKKAELTFPLFIDEGEKIIIDEYYKAIPSFLNNQGYINNIDLCDELNSKNGNLKFIESSFETQKITTEEKYKKKFDTKNYVGMHPKIELVANINKNEFRKKINRPLLYYNK